MEPARQLLIGQVRHLDPRGSHGGLPDLPGAAVVLQSVIRRRTDPERRARLAPRTVNDAERGERVGSAGFRRIALAGLACACAGTAAACADSLGLGTGFSVSITAGPTEVRQGDVVVFGAAVTQNGTPSGEAPQWSVRPAGAGMISGAGRFVAYQPGAATIVAEAQGARAERTIAISPRGTPTGSFAVVGRGRVDARFTSDLWLHGSFAYTGTWGTRDGAGGPLQGDRLYAWDISDPAAPRLTDSVLVSATTVNDVKIRADGTLAALTHEGAPPNGITLLDISDPLHPQVITRFTETLEPGVHNVWIEGDFVYVVVDGSNPNAGLRILDVSNPTSPVIVASFYGGNPSSNFGQFLHDVYVRDGLAFLSHWDAGLIILDVGDGRRGGSPQAPVEVGRLITEGGDVHNAWYWPGGGYAFVGEEDFSAPGVMHVVDVSDPSDPREVATFQVPGETPHNFWLDEEAEILYLGWYSQGVHALDVSGELMGELDRQGRLIASSLYDGAGACRTSGSCTWAPQLHAGHVWVSDQNSGLWSLRLDLP